MAAIKSKRTRQSQVGSLSDKLDMIAMSQDTELQRQSSQEKEDDTRQDITRKFVRFYFGILIAIIAGVPIYNLACFYLTGQRDLLIPLKDAILTYSAVVGPTFGLVVAYYFKTSKDNY